MVFIYSLVFRHIKALRYLIKNRYEKIMQDIFQQKCNFTLKDITLQSLRWYNITIKEDTPSQSLLKIFICLIAFPFLHKSISLHIITHRNPSNYGYHKLIWLIQLFMNWKFTAYAMIQIMKASKCLWILMTGLPNYTDWCLPENRNSVHLMVTK